MFDVRNPLAPIVVGSGLIITVNVGNVLLAGVPTTIPSTVIALTQSATNFVHITSGGAVAVNTSSFPSTSLPIAQVTCSQTSITSIVDSRPDFILSSSTGSPATLFQAWGGMARSSAGINNAANQIIMSGFYTGQSITFTNIVVNVTTLDAGNNYDWGIYDSSGVLKAHVGAHTVGATGLIDLPVVGGSASITAGKYYFSQTGVGSTAALSIASQAVVGVALTFLASTASVTASAGGVLPASATIPADSWAASSSVHAFALHS